MCELIPAAAGNITRFYGPSFRSESIPTRRSQADVFRTLIFHTRPTGLVFVEPTDRLGTEGKVFLVGGARGTKKRDCFCASERARQTAHRPVRDVKLLYGVNGAGWNSNRMSVGTGSVLMSRFHVRFTSLVINLPIGF